MSGSWLTLVHLALGALPGLALGYLLARRGRRPAPAVRAAAPPPPEAEHVRHQTQRLQRQLSEADKKHHRLLEVLLHLPDTVNKIGAARTQSELCRITARSLMEFGGAARIGLFVADPARGRYVLEVLGGGARPAADVSFAPGEGRLGALAELIGVRSVRELPPGVAAAGEADQLLRGDLSVSMRRHEGVLAFAALDGGPVDDPLVRRMVQMIADVHAVSAEGVRALDSERQKADLDQLTGLYNRRHLDHRLPDEVARAQSYGTALGVFLFDVDNFKHYNDSHGHPAGDVCLQQVAGIARSVTRGSDVVCRYGGEEFLVILLGADATQAWHHAERIRQAIAAAPIAHASAQPLGCVSISGGLASFPADAGDAASLVRLADEALYRAKEAGRNRVQRAERG